MPAGLLKRGENLLALDLAQGWRDARRLRRAAMFERFPANQTLAIMPFELKIE